MKKVEPQRQYFRNYDIKNPQNNRQSYLIEFS